jgi:serine/threonine-protein kinase/endoribonuclease IRE1
VIRYFYKEFKDGFLYIALELCPASLADVIERADAFPAIVQVFEPQRALAQVTAGLQHLHMLKIVHRDIKPQNILVSRPKNGQHRMLISDFGLCKKLDVDQTSFIPTVHGALAAGTVGWRAPEILRGDVKLYEQPMDPDDLSSSRGSTASVRSAGSRGAGAGGKPTRLTKSVDIFALGCLFYYTLTGGSHPFGDRFEREGNIMKGRMDLGGLEQFGEEGVEAAHLISAMLDQDAKERWESFFFCTCHYIADDIATSLGLTLPTVSSIPSSGRWHAGSTSCKAHPTDLKSSPAIHLMRRWLN